MEGLAVVSILYQECRKVNLLKCKFDEVQICYSADLLKCGFAKKKKPRCTNNSSNLLIRHLEMTILTCHLHPLTLTEYYFLLSECDLCGYVD